MSARPYFTRRNEQAPLTSVIGRTDHAASKALPPSRRSSSAVEHWPTAWEILPARVELGHEPTCVISEGLRCWPSAVAPRHERVADYRASLFERYGRNFSHAATLLCGSIRAVELRFTAREEVMRVEHEPRQARTAFRLLRGPTSTAPRHDLGAGLAQRVSDFVCTTSLNAMPPSGCRVRAVNHLQSTWEASCAIRTNHGKRQRVWSVCLRPSLHRAT